MPEETRMASLRSKLPVDLPSIDQGWTHASSTVMGCAMTSTVEVVDATDQIAATSTSVVSAMPPTATVLPRVPSDSNDNWRGRVGEIAFGDFQRASLASIEVIVDLTHKIKC